MARLWAFMMSLMSPVRPSENSVMGMSRALPPPAAVPLTFMVGPPEGWRSAPPTFFPRFPRPSIRPTDVVLLPSPSGVGVMAVTSMYLPSGLSLRRSMILRKSSFARRPIGSISSLARPSFCCHCSGVGIFFSAASEICQSAILVASYAMGSVLLVWWVGCRRENRQKNPSAPGGGRGRNSR